MMTTALVPQRPDQWISADTDEQFITLFLRQKRSHHTRRAYAQTLAQFLQFTVGKSLGLITLEDLLGYADWLAENAYAKATQALKLSAVKSLLAFGQETGYLRFNVGVACKAPTPENKLAERILSEEDALRVLHAPRSPRDKTILRLLYSGGLRVSELCELQWRHVQPRGDAGQISVYGKGQKTRIVPVSRATFQALMGIKSAGAGNPPGADEYVFASQRADRLTPNGIYRIVRKAGQACGIRNLSPHWLRHAHASHALERGASVAVVRDTLGHSSLAVTNRYLHARPNDSSAFYLAV
jgi:integrase/recombinase XerD